MQSRRLGRSGIVVSDICMGTMTFGEQVNEASAHAIFDRALERGVNFIDTADAYAGGASERIVGAALSPVMP